MMKADNKTAYINVIGRRKEAVARVRLVSDNGQVSVNGKSIDEYFKGEVFKKFYQKPFEVTGTLGKIGGEVLVTGGGVSSQLGAVVHGISRALSLIDKEKYRPLLKKEGLLTRDPRAKERRKYGHAQKARAMKQSPKR